MRRLKKTRKIILFLMMAAFALEGASWTKAEDITPSLSGTLTAREAAVQEEGGEVVMKTTASAANDSVLSHVFASMLNEALQDTDDTAYDENGEWEDPSLEEYPLDPHELWEYGDSLRVRRVTVTNEEGQEIIPPEGEENFFVYRDSFLMISEEEAAGYTTEYSEDRRTVVLSPMPAADDLEGKSGIVLLKEDISQDEILIFEDAPTEEGDSLVIALRDPDSLTLNQIFSDGSLTVSSGEAEVTEAEEGLDPNAKGMDLRDAPKLAAADSLSQASDYYEKLWSGYTKKAISGTNWSGNAYYRTSDLSFRIKPDINVLKLRFNLDMIINAETKFDIRSTGSSGGKQTVDIADLKINMVVAGVDLNYDMEVQFNDVPVHAAGTINNAITVTAGLTPLRVTDSNSVVNYDTIDIAEEHQNKEAEFYIGTKYSFVAKFLQVKIGAIHIGPVFTLTVDFGGGSNVKAVREQNTIASGNITRTEPFIHSCVVNGREGCLDATSVNQGFHNIALKVNLYIKKWNWKIQSSASDPITKKYYHSYTNKTGLQEGECPAKLYRVPVKVYLREENGAESPVAGALVEPVYQKSTEAEVLRLQQDTTDADGNAAIYLPIGDNHVQASTTMPEEMSAWSSLFTVRKENNPTIPVYLYHYQKASLEVHKVWDKIDTELLDRPQSVQFVIEKWDAEQGEWVIAHRKSQPAMPALVTASNNNGDAWKQKTTKAAFDDLVISEVVSVQEGGKLVNKLMLTQYRVRELDGIYVRGDSESLTDFESRIKAGIIADSSDTGLTGTGEPNLASLFVSGYMTMTGEQVPDHYTRYQVEYGANEGTEAGKYIFTVTNIPILEVDLYKRWVDVPEENRPNSVYLALLSSPRKGYLDAISGTGLTEGQAPATEVIEGDTLSLRDLVESGVAEIDLPTLPNQKMAIAQVSEDNNWHAHYVVPKYLQGIPMDYAAAELDGDYLSEMYLQRMGIEVAAYTFHGQGYTDIPGSAVSVNEDWKLIATVINTMEENLIGGVKYWRLTGGMTAADLPDSITIHVLDANKDEVGQVEVKRPVSAEYDYEETMWPWTFRLENGSDNAEYTISETIPADYPLYVEQRIEGYNIINTPIDYSNARFRISKSWDSEYAPESSAVDVAISYQDYTGTVKLRRNADPEPEDYAAELDFDWLKGLSREELQKVQVTELYPIRTLSPQYYGWILVMDGEAPVYTYYISNRVNPSDHSYRVIKTWDLNGKSAEEIGITDSTILTMKFNIPGSAQTIQDWKMTGVKEKLSAETRHFIGSYRTDSIEITESFSDGPVVLKDGELNEKGGFRQQIRSQSLNGYTTYYVTNVWESVDEINTVKASGTVSWDDANNARQVRPDSVKIALFNSHGEWVKTVTVTAADNWQWSIGGLPEKDTKGSTLSYYIMEERPRGYTRTYQPAAYDSGSRTWTLNVANKLTGYYALNVEKVLQSSVSADRDEDFVFEIKAYESSEDSWEEALPYRATGSSNSQPGNDTVLTLKGTAAWTADGSGAYTKEGKYEFLFNEEGLYLYTLQESKGTNAGMAYDTDVRGIMIQALWNENGTELEYTTFVRLLAGIPEAEIENAFDFSEHWVKFTADPKITFTNVRDGEPITIVKTWGIDADEKDHPEEVTVAIQKKASGQSSWTTIENGTYTLTQDEGWVRKVIIQKDENTDYRVVELAANGTPLEENDTVTYTVSDGPDSQSTHQTKYLIIADDQDNTNNIFSIYNQAIETVTLQKKWIGFSEGDAKPESVYLALMGRPLDGTQDDANAPHGEFVYNPFSGGASVDDLKREIAALKIGVDPGLLSSPYSFIAIAKVSGNESVSFEVPKYQEGMEMEYWGVELDETLLRQLLKEVFQADLAVSYDPTGEFISLPSKAVSKAADWKIEDIDDARLLKAGGSLSDADIAGIQASLSSATADNLMAAVVNVKVQTPDENKIHGSVIWRNDTEDKRPAGGVDIHIYVGKDEIEGSPVRVPKAETQSIWTWELSLGDDASPNADFTILEEFQYDQGETDYESHYLKEYRGLDAINTWTEQPDLVVYRIKKIWENPEKEETGERGTGAEGSGNSGAAGGTGSGSGSSELKPGDRTAVSVALYDAFTDNPIGTYTLNEENGWTVTVESVDEGYELNGLQPGSYYIREKDLPQNMKATYLNPTVTEETETITAEDGTTTEATTITTRIITYLVGNWVDDTDTVTVTGQKSWTEEGEDSQNRPDSVQVQLYVTRKEKNSSSAGTTAAYDQDGPHIVTISPTGEWKYFFSDLPKTRTEDGKTYELSYAVREIKPGTANEAIEEGGAFTGKNDQKYTVRYDTPTFDRLSDSWIANIANHETKEEKEIRQITIKKEWDIDLEKKDHPETIEVVVQKLNGGQWTTIENGKIKLSENNDWTAKVTIDDDSAKYRVRELSGEKGILNQLKKMARDYTDQKEEEFKEYIDKVKKEIDSYYEGISAGVPEELTSALEGTTSDVAKKLKEKTDAWYNQLWEKIDGETKDNRIVYDKNDVENVKGSKASVIYHVDGYTSVLSGAVSAHSTKYYVSYSNDKDTYTITNQAVLDIDVIKRWVHLGDGTEKKPSSAWVVLMFKPGSGTMDKAKDLAQAVGVNLSGLRTIDLPAFSLLENAITKCGLLEGGQGIVSILSKMAIGFNIDIFGLSGKLLKVAIVKVDEDCGWKASFVHTKYMLGLPIEFKGAEVTSEIINLAAEYLLGIDPHVSYNFFDNYISVSTPALPSFKSFSMDNLDLSALTGAAKSLLTGSWQSIAEAMGNLLLDQTHLAANVINIQISEKDEDDGVIKGAKVWVNDKEKDRPETLTIHISKENKEIGTVLLKKADFEGKNTWSWKYQLPEGESAKGKYTVSEEYPAGYDTEKKASYNTTLSGTTIYNTWDKVTIAGKKTWVDGNNAGNTRPEKLFIFLLRNGQRVQDSNGKDVYVATSAAANWEYVFINQDKSDENGNAYVYTVEERIGTETIETAEDGTVTKWIDDQKELPDYQIKIDGWNITNTLVYPSEDPLKGTKTWRDQGNNDGVRPGSITVHLLDFYGNEVAKQTVTGDAAADTWDYEFANVPVYDEAGNKIDYHVSEDKVDHYIASSYGMYLVNYHGNYSIRIHVKKVWEDSDNLDGLRPEKFTVELTKNGKTIKTMEIPADQADTDLGSFDQMDDGVEIKYDLKEQEVPGYTATYSLKEENGELTWTITNTHTPETISVSGRKTWDDGENQYGTRPEFVTVKLLKNGTEIKTQNIGAAGEWKYAFDDLPKYENGTEITYTVEENAIPHYTAEYKKTSGGSDIVNTLKYVTLTGVKTWDDGNDQDGKRPGSITVVLSAKVGDTAVAGLDGRTVTISKEDDWRYAFRDLPKYQGTTENIIQYSVTEQTVPDGYDVTYGEAPVFDENTETATQNFTNTHTPETISVSGTKTWDDENDQDRMRPESITVRLMNGSAEVAQRTVTERDHWAYTFTDLPKYANGKEITYTISEDSIPGYVPTISGSNITNTHTTEKVKVVVRKVWDDADNQDGLRPATVEVALRGNGAVLRTATLSAESWSCAWEDIPMNEGGSTISYLVAEEGIEGYTSTQTSNYDADTQTWTWIITNHHTPETITFTGEKVWWDIWDQDGIRPDSIRVKLYGNGTLADSKNVTKEQEWKFTFTDLPKYSGGKLINYTIEEENIPGYTPYVLATEGGAMIINVHVPAEVNLKVTKVWEDANDAEGFRPDSVTVALLRNGSVIRTTELNAENNWTHTFEYLGEKSDGEEVSYSIREYEVDGYTTEYANSGFDQDTMTWTWTITNRHEPATSTIPSRNSGWMMIIRTASGRRASP